jgi:hypothetical protein
MEWTCDNYLLQDMETISGNFQKNSSQKSVEQSFLFLNFFKIVLGGSTL